MDTYIVLLAGLQVIMAHPKDRVSMGVPGYSRRSRHWLAPCGVSVSIGMSG